MNLESVIQNKVSKKREKQIPCIDTNVYGILKKMVAINLFRARNRDADVENKLVDKAGEERLG